MSEKTFNSQNTRKAAAVFAAAAVVVAASVFGAAVLIRKNEPSKSPEPVNQTVQPAPEPPEPAFVPNATIDTAGRGGVIIF